MSNKNKTSKLNLWGIAVLASLALFTTEASAGVELSLVSSTPSNTSPTVLSNATFTLEFDGATPADFDDALLVKSQFFGWIQGEWTGMGTTTLTFTPEAPLTLGDQITILGKTAWTNANGDSVVGFHLTSNVRGLPNPEFAVGGEYVQSDEQVDSLSVRDMAIADLNGDGELDILGSFWQTYSIPYGMRVALNNGNGEFGPTSVHGSVYTAQKIFTSDLDLDGDVDAIITNEDNGSPSIISTVNVFINDGTGVFTQDPILDDTEYGLGLGDFDGDGDDDFVVGPDGSVTGIYIYQNNLSDGGGFDLVQLTAEETIFRVKEAVTGDFNGDGHIDFVCYAQGHLGLSRNRRLSLFINPGDIAGTWTEVPIEDDATVTADDRWNIRSADLNADGHLDILARNMIFLNNGDSTFNSVSISLNRVSFGDMDGDGDLDILYPLGTSTRVFLNDGSASFSSLTLGTDGNLSQAIDYNGDQLMDLLTAPSTGVETNYTVLVGTLLPLSGSITEIAPATTDATVTCLVPEVSGTIQARGVVYSTSPNPTIEDGIATDANNISGTYSIELTGLEPATTYYARSYVTIDGVVHYTNNYEFTTRMPLAFAVGDVGPAGGIIFYVDELDTIPSLDFLELSPASIQVSRSWGCQGGDNPLNPGNEASIGTADLTGLGDGELATQLILAGCDESTIAAQYADSIYIVRNDTLFDDWYLPALDELTTFYDAIQPTDAWDTLGISAPIGDPPYSFWTSTEWYDTGQAQYWSGQFSNFTSALGKDQVIEVRPIRAFNNEPTFGATEPVPFTVDTFSDTTVCAASASLTFPLATYFDVLVGSLTYEVSGGPVGNEWSASIVNDTLIIDFSPAGDDATASLTITAVDNNEDTASQTFAVTELGAPSLTATVNNVTEFGGSDGSISLTGYTGTLLWSSGSTAATRSELSAGSYAVTLTETTSGCTLDTTFSVTQPGQMTLVGTWRAEPATSPSSSDGMIRASFIYGGGTRTVTIMRNGSIFEYDFPAGTDLAFPAIPGVYYILGFSDADGSSTTLSPAVRLTIPNRSCD